MAYALFLVAMSALAFGIWMMMAKTGLLERLIAWTGGRVRRKALVWMVAGIILFCVEWVGIVYLEATPNTSGNGRSGGVGALMGLGWLIAWLSLGVCIRGTTRPISYSTVGNVIVVLAYILLGVVLTIMAPRGWDALVALF